MRFDVIREIFRQVVCMLALPIAILITLIHEALFFASETFAYLGGKVKSFNVFLGIKLERLLSEPPNKAKARVKIDAWGGTSVDPSEVLRDWQASGAPQGRRESPLKAS